MVPARDVASELEQAHVDDVQANGGPDRHEGVPDPAALAEPLEGLGVAVVPRLRLEVGEVGDELRLVDDLHERRGQRWQRLEVALCHHGQEEGTRRDHDGGVGQDGGEGLRNAVVELQLRDGRLEDGVARRGDEQVVGDARRRGRLEDSVVRRAVGLDLVEGDGPVAPGVGVEVDAAIVVEDEVSDGIGALNGERVVVPRIDEPGVLSLDEVACLFIGPVL